jgi:hypothetical protein
MLDTSSNHLPNTCLTIYTFLFNPNTTLGYTLLVLFNVGKKVTVQDIDTNRETIGYLCNAIAFPIQQHYGLTHGISHGSHFII